MSPSIAVIDYGIGNLRSAEKGLCQAGADARLVTSPADIESADGVVLPGVGHFGRCSEALATSGLWDAALGAARDGRPFLGICVGMQLLYESSEEAPGAHGLGVLPGTVTLLPDGVRRPQMQWNLLEVRPGSRLLEGYEHGSWVYFVHSYAPPIGEEIVATCDYGGPVAAAAEEGNLWATQFHPEKSSLVGLGVLSNFVKLCQ
ncbi:MAG TPA: imidazole glycerol phosphate synthase subunit HisH [Acidimicrobiales bacterium]|nr:imidazole glycerol phosphate synthase subunit HisH [Acidimicrobiales bacterium]